MLEKFDLCTGCGACAVNCPLNCIEMRSDQEGFRYPVIDEARCISCRQCEAVCPVLKQNSHPAEVRAFAVKHRSDSVRKASSSGGVFPALAASVLTNCGAVCAAAFDENYSVVHIIVEEPAEIGKLQGAKYAQSRAEHCFAEIKRILEQGRPVLFAGTPCQTAGLHAYLKRDYEKLLLVDMICHGVPSPGVWQRYLTFRRERDADGSAVCAVNQRDKCSGWSRYRYSIRIDYRNGASYCTPQGEDPFLRGFVSNLYLRPSCAQCRFKGTNRLADLTLGDYWGVWDQYPVFDDDKGASLVLIRTEKGAAAWKAIADLVDAIEVDPQEALRQNPSANESSVPHPGRERLFAELEDKPFDSLVLELLYGPAEKPGRLKQLLRCMFRGERKGEYRE